MVINQREIIEMNRENVERVSQKKRNDSVWAMKVGPVNCLHLQSSPVASSRMQEEVALQQHCCYSVSQGRISKRWAGPHHWAQVRTSEIHMKWWFLANPWCCIMVTAKWPCTPADASSHPHVLCNARIMVVDKDQLETNYWGCCYMTYWRTARSDDSHI